MKKLICSIYDEKSELFTNPILQITKGEALRNFITEVESGKSMLSSHPQDFKIYELGTFDDQSAKFIIYDIPRLLDSAINYKKETPTNET